MLKFNIKFLCDGQGRRTGLVNVNIFLSLQIFNFCSQLCKLTYLNL